MSCLSNLETAAHTNESDIAALTAEVAEIMSHVQKIRMKVKKQDKTLDQVESQNANVEKQVVTALTTAQNAERIAEKANTRQPLTVRLTLFLLEVDSLF